MNCVHCKCVWLSQLQVCEWIIKAVHTARAWLKKADFTANAQLWINEGFNTATRAWPWHRWRGGSLWHRMTGGAAWEAGPVLPDESKSTLSWYSNNILLGETDLTNPSVCALESVQRFFSFLNSSLLPFLASKLHRLRIRGKDTPMYPHSWLLRKLPCSSFLASLRCN